MSLPCVEVADAPSTDAYRANPSDVNLVKEALDILSSSPGILKVYHGLQTEDEKRVYVYNVWGVLEDHHKLQADPVVYPLLGKATTSFMATASSVIHIQPTESPYAALEAPATELAFAVLKRGQPKEKLVGLFSQLLGRMYEEQEKFGMVSAVQGPVVEKGDMQALIIGWTSVKAHWDAVTSDPTLISLLTSVREIADISLTHQNLNLYK